MNPARYKRDIEDVFCDECAEVRRREFEASDARSGYEADHRRQYLRDEVRGPCNRKLDARTIFFTTTAGRSQLFDRIGNTRQHPPCGRGRSDSTRSAQQQTDPIVPLQPADCLAYLRGCHCQFARCAGDRSGPLHGE